MIKNFVHLLRRFPNKEKNYRLTQSYKASIHFNRNMLKSDIEEGLKDVEIQFLGVNEPNQFVSLKIVYKK